MNFSSTELIFPHMQFGVPVFPGLQNYSLGFLCWYLKMAADMNALPDEILHYICDLLETIDKLRLACVCQRLRRILSSPLVNKKASFKHCWNIPYKVIQQYLEKNKQWLHHLDLQDCYWLKQACLMSCLYKCTNLVSLDVSGCSVSQKNVVALMERFNSLKHFGWSVDKKTIDDEEEPLKKLNLCFHKLSSLKLLFHQNERIPSRTSVYEILCKFLLSNLCLKYLELVFSMSGNYVSYPFHIAMEVFGNGREMVKSRCHPVEYITTCFPLNLSSTVILPFTNYMHQQTGLFKTIYWENAEMEGLFDGTLQLKNLDISGTKMVEVSRQSICKLLSCQSLEFINIGVRECSDEELLSICSPVLESINHFTRFPFLFPQMLMLENLFFIFQRLEQPFFDITKDFLNALHSAKKLERICLIVNHGKLDVALLLPNNKEQHCVHYLINQ